MTIQPLRINSKDHGWFGSEPDSRIVRCHSRMKMTIYPHANDPAFPGRSTEARRIVFDEWAGTSASSDFSLRQFSWTKAIGRAAGQWQALIRTDRQNRSLFNPMNGDILPGDWVEIELLRDGKAIPVCIGSIDTINRDRRSIGGATRTHWKITGRDHGKVFEYSISYANIFAQTLAEIVNGLMTKRVKGKIGGSPSEMFKVLIEAAFTPGTKSGIWRLPPSLASAKGFSSAQASILDILDIENDHPTIGHYYNEVQLWNKAGQTLHQALQFWCFPLMHRMIFDVAENGEYVRATIREHPYINLDDGVASEWFKLDTWRIPSWLPISDNLARSENERFNIIQLLSNVGWEGSSEEQSVTAQPKYSQDSIERHGLRALNESTHFIGGISGDMSNFAEFRRTQQTRLMEWHAANPYFLSGQINLPVPIPEARVGHRLTIENGTPSEDINLYIEGESLDYQASTNDKEPPVAKSSFIVTRGYRGSDRDGIDLVKRAAGKYSDLLFTSSEGSSPPNQTPGLIGPM